MLLEIAINASAWTLIQLGLAFIATRIPYQLFSIQSFAWEREGRIYELLGVRAWKDKLPDAGNWFPGGFAKRNLRGFSFEELSRFGCEARRGELVHWCALFLLPLFALWNTRYGMVVNAAYAIGANLPCIIVQRFNQARIAALFRQRSTSVSSPQTAETATSHRRWSRVEQNAIVTGSSSPNENEASCSPNVFIQSTPGITTTLQ